MQRSIRTDSLSSLAVTLLRVRGGPGIAGGLCLALAMCAPVAAQGTQAPRFLVSTTNDVGALDPQLPLLTDTDLMIVGGGALPAPWFSTGHWRALAPFAPTDVDGVATIGGEPRAGDFYVSFLNNDGGFKDGDIIALGADGQFYAAIEEETIAAALGDVTLNIDVDALAFDGDGPWGTGRMFFSLENNVVTPVLGQVNDGDVLALDANGTVARIFTEDEVSHYLSIAIGSTAAATDVFGLEYVDGEVWVSVQTPSSHDGAVIALGPFARVIATEDDLALGGEELNAFTLLRTAPPPCLWFETGAGNLDGRGVVQHGTPHGLVVLFAAGASGWIDTPLLGGFGGFALDGADPLLLALLAGPVLPMAKLDENGSFTAPVGLSGGDVGSGPGGAAGITLQMLDVSSGRVTPPFRILP